MTKLLLSSFVIRYQSGKMNRTYNHDSVSNQEKACRDFAREVLDLDDLQTNRLDSGQNYVPESFRLSDKNGYPIAFLSPLTKFEHFTEKWSHFLESDHIVLFFSQLLQNVSIPLFRLSNMLK